MRKLTAVGLYLIVPLVLLGLVSVSHAQLVLYDDFDVKPINPAKWQGSEGTAGSAAPNTESARKLAGKQLSISLTTWGKTDSDMGDSGNQSNRLGVTNPVPVTTIQADVTVKSAKVLGCAANSTATIARAQVNGGFFNDGTSPGAGDRTGDIIATIQKASNSIAGNRIEAVISRCTNSGCTAVSTLAIQLFIAKWTKGIVDTLRVQWDPTNNRFIYTVNPGGANEVIVLTYTVPDANAPIVNFKQVAANNSVASCASPLSRANATMKALFDNVMVNP